MIDPASRSQQPTVVPARSEGDAAGDVDATAAAAGRTGRQYVEQINTRFTHADRRHTTLLVGGLTLAQDQFVAAAFRGSGFRVQALATPDNAALRIGKEFGNRGQCNPAYYMVGNLVKYLMNLRDYHRLSTEEIIEGYAFLTAGACGPCRFGAYITEYRKALRDSGFGGFRVLTLSQTAWLKQSVGHGGGLQMGPRLTARIRLALIAGDILNCAMCRIRPYERRPGETDRAIAKCRQYIAHALERRRSLASALRQCRRELSAIEVDRTQVKPRVAIIGEFWAMTTEGDGNYHLQQFLEQEGAEVEVPSITAWLLYLAWTSRYDTRTRMLLTRSDDARRGLQGVHVRSRLLRLWLVERSLIAGFRCCAKLMGCKGYRLPDMDKLAEISHQYYDSNNRGGEGHMEVGKLILNAVSNKVDLTVSVKPFGCLPSSCISDGVQSSIIGLHPGALFLPIETSGDGAANVYSRAQMQLSKARERAEREFQDALDATAQTEDVFRRRLRERGFHRDALHHSLQTTGCTAADLVYEVGRLYRA